MFLAKKKLTSYILLLILGFAPLISTAAMVRFDLNKIDEQSMQESSVATMSQGCMSGAMDNSCGIAMNSCGACVLNIDTPHSQTAQKNHSTHTVAFQSIQFSFISAPNTKPPRT